MKASKASFDKKQIVHAMIAKELANRQEKKAKRGVIREMVKEAKATGRSSATKSQPAIRPFGGVTEMDVAPVSIGNSVRAVKQSMQHSQDSVRIVGRDYVTTIGGQLTSAYPNFVFQTGLGLSPVALNASGLRGFFQAFEKFKWNKCNAHYITSSPTSTAGDILMFYHSNHAGPKVDSTSSNFLSYALSTDAAVLGPQWTNHSVSLLDGPRPVLDTDLFNSEDVQHQADGELLVYCRNTQIAGVAESPGYLLIDYDITFSKRMLNPRVQTIPSSVFKWTTSSLSVNATVNDGDPVAMVFAGVKFDGSSAAGPPTGFAVGEIFQIVFDISDAVLTNWVAVDGWSTKATLATAAYVTFPVTVGTTIYGVLTSTSGSGNMFLYPTYDACFGGNTLVYHNHLGAIIIQTPVTMCCVGSVNAVFTQSNIG